MEDMVGPVRRGARALFDATATLADLALPTTCAGCGAAGVPVCAECSTQVARATAYPRIVAGRAGTACTPDGFVVAGAPYEGVLRRMIVAFKDGDRRDLLPALAPGMRAVLVAAWTLIGTDDRAPHPGDVGRGSVMGRGVSSPVPVIPAPSSARSRRARGDVPTHRLVREALRGAAPLACPWVWAPVLRHTRRVSDQASLGRAERLSNTDHAFRVCGPTEWLRGRDVVVADDVVTTGATARECVRALREVGARPVAVIALAATPHPSGGVGAGMHA